MIGKKKGGHKKAGATNKRASATHPPSRGRIFNLILVHRSSGTVPRQQHSLAANAGNSSRSPGASEPTYRVRGGGMRPVGPIFGSVSELAHAGQSGVEIGNLG